MHAERDAILEVFIPPVPAVRRQLAFGRFDDDVFSVWLKFQARKFSRSRTGNGSIKAGEYSERACRRVMGGWAQSGRSQNITTTARHYAGQKAHIHVGLGEFLDISPKLANE